MPERRRLGAVYTLSPAQKVRKWCVENTSKLIFSIISCIIWLFILFVFTGVVNFLGAKMGQWWPESVKTIEIYNRPYMFPIKVIGCILVVLYIFRDSTSKRR